MKVKTRILAMLLTALMVIGILPLSLFAIDGARQSPISLTGTEERTLEEIRGEFSKQNVDLLVYQTFSGLDSGALTVSPYKQNIATKAEYAAMGDSHLQYANNRASYSIKTDADGNKSLFLAAAPKPTTKVQNYIDFNYNLPVTTNKVRGTSSYDYYVSVDFKMGGVNVEGASLISVCYFTEELQEQTINLVSVSDVGGLYLGDNDYSPEKLVGFLSQDEYARIAFATDRVNNKYYVYINGVLVNPQGTELIPQSAADLMNQSRKVSPVPYTQSTVPLYFVRVYCVEDHIDTNVHKGMYMDNFLMGARLALKEKTTEVTVDKTFNVKQTNVAVSNANGIGGNFPTSFMGGLGAAKNENGAIRYIDEDGDQTADAIEWHKVSSGGAFLQIEDKNTEKGTNLRFSVELKGGPNGQSGKVENANKTTAFIYFRTRNRNITGDYYDVRVSLEADGTLWVPCYDANGYLSAKKVIGKITPDKYTKITIDIVCNINGGNPAVLFYVDDVLMHTHIFVLNYSDAKLGANADGGYATNDYHPNLIRFCEYDGEAANLLERDIRVREFSYATITDYDNSGTSNRISVFEDKPTGLSEVAGIERYYNGNSTFKTEDFTLGDEKYIVGFGGSIIGKESDGVEFAPYASYTDWTHSQSFILSLPEGNPPMVSLGNITPSNYFQAKAKISGISGDVTLHTFYYDETLQNLNNYVELSIPEDKRINSHLVFDFDLMMAENIFENDYSDSNQSFLGFVYNKNADGSGDNDEMSLLKISSEGWLIHGEQKLVKISKKQFARLSVVIDTPNDTANGSFDIYANGVKILENISMETEAKNVEKIKFLSVNNQNLAFYLKDIVIYESEKPQQFIDKDTKELTSDQSATPAKASDIKKGFVSENGVVRYYDDAGLLKASISGILDFEDNNGIAYKADKNGIVYTFKNNEASADVVDYTVSFDEVQNGDYGYVAGGAENTNKIFAATFKKLYFTSGEYSSILLNLYLPETNTANFDVWLGEAQRFYEVEWLGGNKYKFDNGTYFVNDAIVPEGAKEAASKDTYTLENGRGGEQNLVYFDIDDIEGISSGDKFYVRTVNRVRVFTGSFADLVAGWNTIQIPVNTEVNFDIDYIELISDTALESDYIARIKVCSIKLTKMSRFVMNKEDTDGIYDGYYYKDGIAQTGWIDENSNNQPDKGDYYANPNTAKIVTGIYSVGGVWYKFDTDGKLLEVANGIEYAKNGFDKFGNAVYAYKKFDSGVIVTTGLIETGLEDQDKKFIYTDANGVSLQNTTKEVAGAVYSFDAEGYGMLLCADENAHKYGEAVTVKAATCKSKGLMESICEICGNVKQTPTDEDPNFHERCDEYGKATCCQVDAKADGVTSVSAHSITISKSVTIIFYLDITEGSEGWLEIGRRSEFVGNTTQKVSLSELKSAVIGTTTYKTVEISVAPNAIDSIVRIRYIRPDGFYGSEYEYKFSEYIDAVIAHEQDDVFTAELKNLVNAFKVYADNANKVVYGDKVEAPETITETIPNDNNIKWWPENQENEQTGYIKFEKTYENISFLFGETLELEFNFILDGAFSGFTFYVNGEKVNAYRTNSGYAVKAEINAVELDKEIVITVKHISGSEVNVITSAIGFAKRMNIAENAGDDEKNLMKAIYLYNEAVKAYVAAIAPPAGE